MSANSARRYAIVTGAAGGIGAALLAAFARAGHRTIAVDKRPLEAGVAAEHFISLDLTSLAPDPDAAQAFRRNVQRIVGEDGVAVLVNNAALQIVKPVEELTAADFAETMAVNTVAPFVLVKTLLPELEKGSGSVVNISSVHARLTKPRFVAYATSKAGLSGLTRSLSVELGARVRVNAIEPAAIETPMLQAGFEGNAPGYDQLRGMHPVGRIGLPEEVASLAVFLASDSARFINGAVYEIDGGISARLHDPD